VKHGNRFPLHCGPRRQLQRRTSRSPAVSRMKRTLHKAPSPTPTAFSGISHYRTGSYRPLRVANNAPAVPTIGYRLVSKTHFYGAECISGFLPCPRYVSLLLCAISCSHIVPTATPSSRSTARQKLTRLTIQRFHQLSTDVYDELICRNSQNEGAIPSGRHAVVTGCWRTAGPLDLW
jgi:hypothetical protein